MPPERVKRQEPVSCQQCRRKKLRCDRQLPCASCQARDTQCTYSTQRRAVDVEPKHESSPAEWTDLHHLRAENTSIKARLQALEEIILPNRRGLEEQAQPNDVGRLFESTPLRAASSKPESGTIWASESGLLEPVGVKDKSRTPNLTSPVTIRVMKLQDIIDQSAVTTRRANVYCIPTLDESITLVRLYLGRIDTLQHIIHLPSVITTLEQLYGQLHQSLPCKLSHIALVLGITATIVRTWGRGEQGNSIVATPRVAAAATTYCIRGALDMLDQAWRSQSPDLVAVQANIVLAFLLYHTEAFSPNVRILHANAIALAKEIGLHLTDSVTVEKEVAESRDQIVEKEMHRRVWWHLTALDWNLSLNGGPQEGTYNINPRHIRVRKPRNINNEDLATMPADFSRPLSEATAISYYLHCIPIGEVCREVADVTWDLAGSGIDNVRYANTILQLDKKFDDLLAKLPPYLSMERMRETSRTSSRLLWMQRHLVNLTIHARRCKLHLPFLLRTARNDFYKPSRVACLHAARSILKLRECASGSGTDSSSVEVNLRLAGILRHFFCAVVVLVMDLYANCTADLEQERMAEIQDACTIFKDARQHSASAGLFLDALGVVMHKNKVPLRTQGLTGGQETFGLYDILMDEARAPNQPVPQYSSYDNSALVTNLGFDDLWQRYIDRGSDVDPQEWDTLFAHLDTTMQ